MINGLTYISNFITSEEQDQLIQRIDTSEWRYDLKRRTQHYGYKCDYTKKTINASMRAADIPEWIKPYCTKLVENGVFKEEPDQIIINEYQPGQGISSHVDCVPCFSKTICSLSLLSGCKMVFNKCYSKISMWKYLEPCSLLVLSDEARYKWMHSINPVKEDYLYIDDKQTTKPRQRRLSLTFRQVILNEYI